MLILQIAFKATKVNGANVLNGSNNPTCSALTRQTWFHIHASICLQNLRETTQFHGRASNTTVSCFGVPSFSRG